VLSWKRETDEIATTQERWSRRIVEGVRGRIGEKMRSSLLTVFPV